MASDGGNQWDDEPRIELRGDPAYRQRGVDYGTEAYMEEEELQQRAPGRGFGPLRFALAGLALIVFAGLVFYAYSWGTSDPDPEELPVVSAPPGVEKEPPANPGGMEVPYQDSMVLNPQNRSGEDVERLLPPPEEPQPREDLAAAQSAPGAVDSTASEQQAEVPEAPGEPQAGDEQTAAGEEASAPEVSEETVVPETPTPDMQGAEAPAEQEAPVEAAPAAPVEEESVEPEPAPAEQAAAPAEPEAPPAAASGNFVIQLASASNRDAVAAEWTRMQQRHPQQLGSLQLLIEEADLGERGTFYRLQAGPVGSRETADSLCAALKAQQQDCLVRTR